MLTQNQRARKMLEMFQARLRLYFGVNGNRSATDIGCESGAGILALSEIYDRVLGIDPSLPNLILARKAGSLPR